MGEILSGLFFAFFSFRMPPNVRWKVRDKLPNTYKGVDEHMAEKNIITNPKEKINQTVSLTEKELERDFHYHIAVKLTKKLLGEGRITKDEYEHICREHVHNYRPTLAAIMA